MKNQYKILIFLFSFIIIGMFIFPTNIKADIQQHTKSTIADKDTYVDTADPLANFGGANYLWCGFGLFSDIREAYFYFNFPDKPSNITKAELSLDIWGVTETMVLTFSVIEENWNEYTMDWTTKPAHGQLIGYLVVTTSDIYKYDITSLLAAKTEISICVNMSIVDYVDDFVYITSREGYFVSSDAPQIIWTYLVDVPVSQISSYNFFLIIGIITIAGFFLMKKLKIKKLNN